MWKPKNFGESLIPLQTTYAILGHSAFQYPVGRPHRNFSLIYAIITTSLYAVALGFTLDYCFKCPWYGQAEKIFFSVIYTNVAIAGLAQILNWYHNRTCFLLVKKMSMVDETLQQLGATFDYARCLHLGIALVVIWLIMIFTCNAVDLLWLHNLMPIGRVIIIVSILHHTVHINAIVAFNFSMIVRLIEMRFRKANEILEKVAISSSQQPEIGTAWEFLGDKKKTSSIRISTRQFLNGMQNRKSTVQIIKHVHLELIVISEKFIKANGVQLVLEITADFVLFTGILYIMYTLLINPTVDKWHLRIFVLVIWLGTYFTKLIVINQACESVTTEARRTGDIIHLINESMMDDELVNEIKQFSLQMIEHPLLVSPVGLFTLNFKFVQGFLGAVTTYLVILIQMSAPDNEQKH